MNFISKIKDLIQNKYKSFKKTTNHSMNSIFLLSKQEIEEAHFNLFIDGKSTFLDVGLKLRKDQKIELFLPWKSESPDDLFKIIKEKEVLCALFNQHLNINSSTGSSQYITADLGAKKFDVVCAKVNKVEINYDTYTKFTIERHSTATSDIAYLRLRFKGTKTNFFNKCHTGSDAAISPVRESIEVIDFRINEVRSVYWEEFPTDIENTPGIKKLHFFLLKSYKEVNTLANPSYHRCRELEDKPWETYLPNRDADDATLAYHWKSEDEIIEKGHYAILAIFNRKQTSISKVVLYICIIIFISWLSCYIFEWSKPHLPFLNQLNESSHNKSISVKEMDTSLSQENSFNSHRIK
jgi:hypothetical protein